MDEPTDLMREQAEDVAARMADLDCCSLEITPAGLQAIEQAQADQAAEEGNGP